MSHPEMVRAKSYHTGGAAITGTNNEEVPSANEAFTFDLTHCFLGSAKPTILDTSLIPSCTLIINLHGNEVLSTVAGVTMADFKSDGTKSPTYTLQHIRFLCECIGLGSGVYDQLIERRLADSVIEIPFKQYTTCLDTHNGSTRFHVSCQSLDRLWAVFRAPGYDDQGAPVSVQGSTTTGGFISATSGGTVNVEVGLPQYDSGSNLSEKYIQKYDDMYFGANNALFQFQINGSLTPGFNGNIAEWFEISRNAVTQIPGGVSPCKTLDQYRSNFSVICHRLCLPNSDVREISGMDCRGVNLSGSLNSQNLPANTNVTIFLEHTSVLQISNQKQIAVVT